MSAPPERDPSADRPHRIAFVVTRSDAVGGVQIAVLELARALQAAGQIVRVFVGGDGPYVPLLREAGVPTTTIPAMIRDIDPRAELRASVQLLAALRRFEPELISTHSSKAGILGRVIGLGLRVPVIMTAHGWPLMPGKLSPRQQLIRLVEAGAAPLARRLIAVCEHDRRIALEHRIMPASKIVVVHNALPDIPATLLARPERAPARLIMVARLEAPKDPLTVAAALGQLRELEWRCELIGDGPQRAELQAALRQAGIEERVDLLGARDDVPERLAEAQIFMLATHREGFPLSILEAMRAGLPVVASDVGGIGEAVVPECGALVEARSPTALASALAPLIRDPELRRRLGAAGRARFLAEFQFDVHVRRAWAVYVEAIERGPVIQTGLSARS
jgi:glycosyltransferase involved in cell wall biosynthesis